MSCKMDTNGSLCLNTAAGCISRHQLVHFHNGMGPRAQRGLRCTVWQHKHHNSSFLTVQWFIWGQQFFPVSKCKVEGALILLRTVSGCWTVHFSRQTPQRGKSRHPNRSSWEAAPAQPWARLWAALQSVRSHRGQYSRCVYSTVLYQKHRI